MMLSDAADPVNEAFGGTVTSTADSGAGSLRQVIADAPSGDTITFAGGVSGTITLSTGSLVINKGLTINGPGASVLSISGNNVGRVLRVSSDNAPVVISGLTFCNGFFQSPVQTSSSGIESYGGGIYMDGYSTLTLNSCMISNNAVVGGASTVYYGATAFGGGLYGQITLNSCVIASNTATGGTGPLGAYGGVGGGAAGSLIMNGCTIIGNTARGPDVPNDDAPAASGGGLYCFTKTALTNCVVIGNLARGGDGNDFASGQARGGGVYLSSGQLTLSGTTLTGNSARGGNGLTVDNDGDGGDAAGGGICSDQNAGSLTMLSCTVYSNNATGGTGQGIGHGGDSEGGGINCESGYGVFLLMNCTVTTNSALGGTGGMLGQSIGGGIYNSASMTITNSTVSHNAAIGSVTGNGNAGGGLYHVLGSVTISGSLFAKNAGVGSVSPDVRATLNSASRFNLIGNGGSSLIGITNGVNGNIIGTQASPIDPLLGPLQNNGGSTLTRALLAGSPAIDKGYAGSDPVDQRGIARPFDDPAIANATGGDGSDIGAFELAGTPAPTLKLVQSSPTQLTISWSPNTAGFVLRERTNLTTGVWANSPSGATNPITMGITPTRKFYQLFKP